MSISALSVKSSGTPKSRVFLIRGTFLMYGFWHCCIPGI